MVKKLHNSLRYEKIRVDIDRGDSMPDFIENVRLSDDGKAVVILDQTQLPNRKVYLRLETAEDIYDAIYLLKVRGAPAIGICGAYGMYCLALQMRGKDKPDVYKRQLVPFVISHGCYLLLLFWGRNMGKKWPQITAAVFMGLAAMIPGAFPGVYRQMYLPVWGGVFLMGVVLLGLELHSLFKKLSVGGEKICWS